MYGHSTTETYASSEGLASPSYNSVAGLLLFLSTRQRSGGSPRDRSNQEQPLGMKSLGDSLRDSSHWGQFQGQKPSGDSTRLTYWSMQLEGIHEATCK